MSTVRTVRENTPGRQRASNFVNSLFAPNVRKQVMNGLHFTAMSGIAALTTNALNAWMQDRGMTGRSFAITVVPNQTKQVPQNPLKRTP